jgi:Lipopolysaccharide kinase (Kdo/WaaP) family
MAELFSQPAQPPVVSGSWTRVVRVDASLPEDFVTMLHQQPAALLDRGEELRSNGARRTVRLNWQSRSFVLKHYVEPTRRHALKQLVLPSRAWSTWSFTHRLAASGVTTPRPVACVENRWGPLRRDSFLLYPYVEGRTLRSYFTAEAKQSPAIHDRLWRLLNDLWQRLVELRVSLGDTNLGNFIVTPDDQLWLIDLDKSRFHRSCYAAYRHQRRAWNQLLRSAAKCGSIAVPGPENLAA